MISIDGTDPAAPAVVIVPCPAPLAVVRGVPVVGDVWFRYVDSLRAPPVDEHCLPLAPARVSVDLVQFKVRKVTPCGVWLARGDWDKGRFVLNTSRKRYACPSQAEALSSFIARKERQAGILRAQLSHVTSAIRIAQGRPDPAIPSCTGCGTTENLHRDLGSGGPYRCSSLDCLIL